MQIGDYVRVREPAVLSKKRIYAYEYVGRVESVTDWSVGVRYEGEDGSTMVFTERRTSVEILSPLHQLAMTAGD